MTVCPKCGSSNTYEIGRDYGCRMCGKQFPRGAEKQIVVTKRIYERKETMAEIEKTKAGQKGTCVNCKRPDLRIADKEGLCHSCHSAVKDIPIECAANRISALAAVKERLTGASPSKPAKKKSTRSTAVIPAKAGIQKTKKSTLDMTVKEVAGYGLGRIINNIDREIALHLAEVEKLQKAKSIIQRV